MLVVTLPKSPLFFCKALMDFFFRLPFAISDVRASRFEIFLYVKLAKIAEAIVAAINSESAISNSGILEF